jgi:hypothetical protein
MTADEIRYVCSAIPLQDTVGYFKRYPEDFAKIMRGFRPTSLKKQEQSSEVLFRKHNQHFISSFIEKYISRWLDEIDAAISAKTKNGASRESALLQTLPHCFFDGNIELYFKLIGKEYSEEFVGILGESIKIIKDSDSNRKQLESTLKDKSSEVKRNEAELERIQTKLNKANKSLCECLDEIKSLMRTNADLEKLKGITQFREQEIDTLKKKIQEREDYIKKLKVELSVIKDDQWQLKVKFREELEIHLANECEEQTVPRKPKCPKDIDEFKDYLGYNLADLGVPTDADYYPLLKDYLGTILFQGKPVIISRNTSTSLMKCISNALVKTPNVPTLTFISDITGKAIDSFLSQDKRIVCLDNFIGNYNETILLTICDKHKDKIIILTVAYERTLCYVPDELMKYCQYLNLNRIEAFVGSKELTESPSAVDETEIANLSIIPDARWSPVLKEMLDTFGIRSALSVYKSSLISDEQSMCRLLAFDILPYCTDVLQISPFHISERLVKYAGDGGRCPYKNLFRMWFT